MFSTFMDIIKHVHLFLYVQINWTLAEVTGSHSLLHVGVFVIKVLRYEISVSLTK